MTNKQADYIADYIKYEAENGNKLVDGYMILQAVEAFNSIKEGEL